MTRPIIRIHDTATNEVIDREMTEIEFAQYQADQDLNLQRQAEAQAKAQAKAALLERLGLTQEEFNTLIA